MATVSPKREETTALSPKPTTRSWTTSSSTKTILTELRRQSVITIPLIPMNSMWVIKTAITTAFLGRMGELKLAAGMLGLTFANITGISILTGLCMGMEPICGQANGLKNRKLLHKTLFKGILMLFATAVPMSIIWINVDKIFLLVGQRRDMALLAKRYVIFLLPDLAATAVFYPLKSYLSSQGITLPILLCSVAGLSLHLPFNLVLSKAKGLEGVSLATSMTDIVTTTTLAVYVLVTEKRRSGGDAASEEGGGWWEQRLSDWLRLVLVATQCCFKGCFEWWCYEILILLSGRLPNSQHAVAVLTVVLNFDYFVYSFMMSVATSASTRVANEIGAGAPQAARTAAHVALGTAFVGSVLSMMTVLACRRYWGMLFSHDVGVVEGVWDMLPFAGGAEVFNFVLVVCGGIIRGTTAPGKGMWSVAGMYLVGLPVGVSLAFKAKLGLEGMLIGLVLGIGTSTAIMGTVVARIKWAEEAAKAQKLGGEARAAERVGVNAI